MPAILTRAPRPLACFVLSTVLSLIVVGLVAACETPVFRYAMYRWSPTPYEVYYFHDKPADEPAERVAELILEASEKTTDRVNLIYLPVDVAADPELNTIPPDIKEAWQQRQDKTLPAYLVSTPYGVEIFSGELDPEAIAGLVESPARQDLAKQLEAGKIGVFVLLGGSDKEETQRVEGVLQQLSQAVAAGKLSLYVSPNQQVASDEAESTESAESTQSKVQHELGIVRVARDSPEEQWFVRTLLAMESDLKEEKRAMVFLVYGRARALLPYIGEGITRENLIREVEFISGACSCTVKEQNPGVDLLVRYDWDSAAAAVADRFGSEEGNESQFGVDMFFPDLVIPSENADTADALASTDLADEEQDAEEEDDEAAPLDAESSGRTSAGAEAEQESGLAGAGTSETASSTASAASSEVDTVVATANTTSAEDAAAPSIAESSGGGSILIVGAGLAVAVVVLFGLTFFVMRPR